MEDHYQVDFDGSVVKVILKGKEDIDVASRLWADVVKNCEESSCYRVLGVAETTGPLGTMDSYHHAELFEKLGITHKYRIAWVELNAEAFKAAAFAETVLRNRGLPGRLFSSEAEAMAWLMQE